MSQSLLSSFDGGIPSNLHVRVYDDCSPELSRAKLESLFPYAAEIVVREKNLKADLNMRTMYDDFLRTDDDVFVSADSDLIFRPGWLDALQEYLPQTDGILSLYNSNRHPFEGKYMSNGGGYFVN